LVDATASQDGYSAASHRENIAMTENNELLEGENSLANETTPEVETRKCILQLSNSEARGFFLKPESYCGFDFPPYIQFGDLIDAVHKFLDGKKLSDVRANDPRDFDDINYTILNNKDGKYAWRPFQLIHPALYVSLVHHITESNNWQLVQKRFNDFSSNNNIRCLSLPVVSLHEQKDKAEQVSQWWHEVEQRSIELSLEYDYLIETDVTDCYGAIYTHSIAWALHTKPTAKAKENRKDKNLLGNIIDNHIQDMRHGQTNGIPQGSTLMDFIAEMVLGLSDEELSVRILAEDINDYCILRYRDDYRIFVNNPQVGEKIVKLLTETMIGLGFKLNPSKTKASNDVIRASIKADKLAWVSRKQSEKSVQKHLLIIHDHAIHFPNSGSLVVALNDFYKRLLRIKTLVENPMPLIAVIIDIAYRNPRTYASCAAVLSKLMSFVSTDEEKVSLANKIKNKFAKIPNTGHMQIWIQRVTLSIDSDISFEEPICQMVSGEKIPLWNNSWISSEQLKTILNRATVVNRQALETMEQVIPANEIELFITKVQGGYY
jgi:hypothetical protein